MQTTVFDQCPEATPARRTYLRARVERALGSFEFAIAEASIFVQRASPDAKFEVRLEVLPKEGAPLRIAAERRELPRALADVFDVLEERLRATLGKRRAC